MTRDMIAHLNRLAADDKFSTAIDAPYYLHGKPLTGALPADSTTAPPPSREPAVITIDQEPTDTTTDQPTEADGAVEPAIIEVPLESQAPLAEYTVNAADPVPANPPEPSDSTTADSTLWPRPGKAKS